MSSTDLCEINGNQYYNVIMANNTNNYIEASYNETRITPILTGMQNYQACIAYFKIDLQNSLPLFIWEDATSAVHGYWVGMEHNGVSVDLPLVYDPVTADVDINTKLDNNQVFKYVYNIQTLIYTLNTTLTALYLAVGGANHAPFCYLEETTNKINFVFDALDSYFPNGADPLQFRLYFNNKLYSFFSALPAKNLKPPTDIVDNTTSRDFLLKVYPFITNTYEANKLFDSITYKCIVVKSTNNVQDMWLRCFGFSFESNIFPLNSQKYSTFTSNDNNTTFQALDDFLFDSSDDLGEKNQTSVLYHPRVYRWFDVVGIGDLNQFSINVLWFGKKTYPREIFQLYIAPEHDVSMKIYFKPKSKLVCLSRPLINKYIKEYEEDKVLKVKKIK